MGVGRKPGVFPALVVAELHQVKDQLYQDDRLVTLKNPIWKALSDKFQGKMSPCAVRTFVLFNRHQVLEKLGLQKYIRTDLCRGSSAAPSDLDTSDVVWDEFAADETASPCSSPASSFLDSGEIIDEGCSEYDPDEDMDDISDPEEPPEAAAPEVEEGPSVEETSGNVIPVSISLSWEEWKNIRPEEVKYSKHKRYRMKRGLWVDVINEAVWAVVKTPCAFVRFRHQIKLRSAPYVSVNAQCKDCQGILALRCENPPKKDNSAVFRGKLVNVDRDVVHKSKRPMSGMKREEVARQLWSGRVVPHVWRAMAAKSMMEFGDPEPSHLPSLPALRQIKFRAGKAKDMDQHPALSLEAMSGRPPYEDSIRDIGLRPFLCHYWSKTQLQMNQFLATKAHTFISIDATASFLRRIPRPGNKSSGRILLYQAVMGAVLPNGDRCPLMPVAQMLTEKPDGLTVSMWLKQWVRSGGRVPNECVCVFSLALLGALVRAFTSCASLTDYMNDCFALLNGRAPAKVPACFIRMDAKHCIRLISRWDCLKRRPIMKDFYVKSFDSLIRCQDFMEARQILHSLVVVATSKKVGHDSTGQPVPSELCKKYLCNISSAATLDSGGGGGDQDKKDPFEPPDAMKDGDDGEGEESRSDFHVWVQQVIDQSQSESAGAVKGNQNNKLYLPDLVDKLRWLAPYLPLWTAIMAPVWRSPNEKLTSSKSEFRHLRGNLLKNEALPVKIDTFVGMHLDDVEGRMLLLRPEVGRMVDAAEPKSDQRHEEEEEVQQVSIIEATHVFIEEWPNNVAVVEWTPVVEGP